MNAWILLQELKKALEEPLQTLPLPVRKRESNVSEKPEWKPATIYLGSMPPTVNDAVSAAPFVVLQVMDGYDDADGHANIRVAIRLCIVANDLEEAENHLQNLISLIRLYLLAMPGGRLGKGHFRLAPFFGSEGKLAWERPDEQALPFLQAHIFSQWQTAGASQQPEQFI